MTDLTDRRRQTSKIPDIEIEGTIDRRIPEGELNATFEVPELNEVSSIAFMVDDTTGLTLIIPQLNGGMTRVDALDTDQCVVVSGALAPLSPRAFVNALREGAPDPNPIDGLEPILRRSRAISASDVIIIEASWTTP